MISKRLEVKRTLVLEFSLPGVEAYSRMSSTGSEHQHQLDNKHSESWSLRVDQRNAGETADIFAGLAKAIREGLEGGS